MKQCLQPRQYLAHKHCRGCKHPAVQCEIIVRWAQVAAEERARLSKEADSKRAKDKQQHQASLADAMGIPAHLQLHARTVQLRAHAHTPCVERVVFIFSFVFSEP